MKVHDIDTHLLAPRCRSYAKVKVKYEGHIIEKKKSASETLVFHNHS